MTPLEFLQAIYLNPDVPLPVRMRAAVEAAPYVHATYKATALVVSGGDFADRLERAIQRSRQPRAITIEAEPIEPEPVVDPGA